MKSENQETCLWVNLYCLRQEQKFSVYHWGKREYEYRHRSWQNVVSNIICYSIHWYFCELNYLCRSKWTWYPCDQEQIWVNTSLKHSKKQEPERSKLSGMFWKYAMTSALSQIKKLWVWPKVAEISGRRGIFRWYVCYWCLIFVNSFKSISNLVS